MTVSGRGFSATTQREFCGCPEVSESDNPEAGRPMALDESENDFRSRARRWLDMHAVPRGAAGDFSASHLFTAKTLDDFSIREREVFDKAIAWQRSLYAAGWAGLSWPQEFGGQGGPEWADVVFAEEQARYGVSTKVLSIGLQMAASVIRRHGSDSQQRRYLLPIIRADKVWCQLFSEPDAGSDLAGIRSQAVATGVGWRVTGQKVWTSGAGVSDLGLLLARTDPHSNGRFGLSCFVVPMRTAGIEVRPLREMSGAYHFNEVFLSEVELGQDALIGEEGDGWSVARTMLSSERSAIGGGTSARSAQDLIRTATSVVGPLGRPGPLERQLVAAAYIRERVLDLHQQRVSAGDSNTGASSIGKLMYSEHARLSSSSALQILGLNAVAGPDERAEVWRDRFLFAPGLRIAGGTDQIQRNIIAERGLGLPREPKAQDPSQ
jgi:alkylation response protein AidB-like acyl-CoA dehydrogenase